MRPEKKPTPVERGLNAFTNECDKGQKQVEKGGEPPDSSDVQDAAGKGLEAFWGF